MLTARRIIAAATIWKVAQGSWFLLSWSFILRHFWACSILTLANMAAWDSFCTTHVPQRPRRWPYLAQTDFQLIPATPNASHRRSLKSHSTSPSGSSSHANLFRGARHRLGYDEPDPPGFEHTLTSSTTRNVPQRADSQEPPVRLEDHTSHSYAVDACLHFRGNFIQFLSMSGPGAMLRTATARLTSTLRRWRRRGISTTKLQFAENDHIHKYRYATNLTSLSKSVLGTTRWRTREARTENGSLLRADLRSLSSPTIS